MSRHKSVESLSVRHDRNLRRFIAREQRKIRPVAASPSSPSLTPASQDVSTSSNYVRYRGTKIMQDEAIAFSVAFSKMKAATKLVNEMSRTIPTWQLVLGFSVDRMEDVRVLKDALRDVRAEIIAADPDPAQNNSFFNFFERFVRIGQWLLMASLTSSQGENELSSFSKRGEFEGVWTGLITALKTLTEYRAYYSSDEQQSNQALDTRTTTEKITAIDTLLHDLVRENCNTLEKTCENLAETYEFVMVKAYESVMWIAQCLHFTYLDTPKEEYAGPSLDDRDAVATTMRHLVMMVNSGHQFLGNHMLKKDGKVLQKYFAVHHRHFRAVLETLSSSTLPEETASDAQYAIDALNLGSSRLVKATVIPNDMGSEIPTTLNAAKDQYVSMISVIGNSMFYPLAQEFHSLHALPVVGFSESVCRNRFVLSLNAAVTTAICQRPAVELGLSLISGAFNQDLVIDTTELSDAFDYWSGGLGVMQHILRGSTLSEAVSKSGEHAFDDVLSTQASFTGETSLTDIHQLVRSAISLYPASSLTSDLSDQLRSGYEFAASRQSDVQQMAVKLAADLFRDEDTANEVRAVDDLADAVLRGAPLTTLRSLSSFIGSANFLGRMVSGLQAMNRAYEERSNRELDHLRALSVYLRRFLDGVLGDMSKKSNAEKASSLLLEIDDTVGRAPTSASDAKQLRSRGSAMVLRLRKSSDNAKNEDSRAVFLILSAIAAVNTSISDLLFSVDIGPQSPGRLGLPPGNGRGTTNPRSILTVKLNRGTQIFIHVFLTILLLGVGGLLMWYLLGSFASNRESPEPSSTVYERTYNRSYIEPQKSLTTEYFVTRQKSAEVTEILNSCNATRFSDLASLPDGESCRNKLVDSITEFAVDIAEDVVLQPDGKSCGQYIGTLLYGAQDPTNYDIEPSVLNAVNRAWARTLNVNQTSTTNLIPGFVGNVFEESGTLLNLDKLNYKAALRQAVETRLDEFIYPNVHLPSSAIAQPEDETNALLVQLYADGIRLPEEIANIGPNYASGDLSGRSRRFFNQLAPYGNCRFYLPPSNTPVFQAGTFYPVPSPTTGFPVTEGTYRALEARRQQVSDFVPNKPGVYDLVQNNVAAGIIMSSFGLTATIFAGSAAGRTRSENIPPRASADVRERTREEAESVLETGYWVTKSAEMLLVIAPLGMTCGAVASGMLDPSALFDVALRDHVIVGSIALGQILPVAGLGAVRFFYPSS